MKHRLGIALAILALTLMVGCDKPSASDCKKAIGNIRRLFGTSQMSVDTTADTAWVRSCRGAAKKSSVQCAINATSLDQLKTCGLLKAKELEEMAAMERDLERLRPAAPVVDAGVVIDAAAAPDGDAGAAATSGDGGAAATPVTSAVDGGAAPTNAVDAGAAAKPPASVPTSKPPATTSPATKPPASTPATKPPATTPPATPPATP